MTLQQNLQQIWQYISQNTNKSLILAFLGLLVYIILFFTFIGKSETFRKYSVITNSLFFISIAISILFMIIKFNGTETLQGRLKSVLLNSLYSIIGIVVLYFIISTMSESTQATTIISFVFQALSILGSLYIFYVLINKTEIIQKLRHYRLFSLLYHAIFLIPCYVFEGGVFVYDNVKDTPLYVLQLFGLQLLFISGWLLIPYIKNKIYNYGGKVLLDKPVHTNKLHSIENNDILGRFNKNINLQNIDMSSSINKDLPYKYAISSWVFINNQGNNMSESSEVLTPLLQYGDKTALLYNSSTNTFQVTSKKGQDGTEVIYTTNSLPLQRWNNIIMNYESGNVDIFLNGELVATKSGIIPYVTHDTITIGSENGVHGGIRNIMYFQEPLNKIKIDWLYNLQK